MKSQTTQWTNHENGKEKYCCLYWRPETTTRSVLASIALLSIVDLLTCNRRPILQSRRIMNALPRTGRGEMMRLIKQHREDLGIAIDLRFDPHATGMIGAADSTLTSKAANLSAKQVSVHPDFAAAIVRMLREAELSLAPQSRLDGQVFSSI